MKALLKGSLLVALLAGSLVTNVNANWDRYHGDRYHDGHRDGYGYQHSGWQTQTRCINGACYKVKAYKRCDHRHCWTSYDRR